MDLDKKQMIKIKEAFLFFSEVKKMLETRRKNQAVVDESVVKQYERYVNDFNTSFPGILEKFNESNYRDGLSRFYSTEGFESLSYQIDGLLTRVIKDTSVLKAKLDIGEISPLVPQKDFSFVTDENLREIIERDYTWVNKCLAVEAWKPVIILAGGLIEALLLDGLSKDSAKARASSEAPKENDILKWDLSNLIDVAVDLSIINPGAEKLGDAVRHYRNLVHPGNEIRTGLKIEPEEAKIAFQVLNIIIRDLQKKP